LKTKRVYRLPTDVSSPIRIDLPISHAGAFAYWVEYDDETTGHRTIGRQGYFNIGPLLRVKARTPILGNDSKPLLPADGGAVVGDEIMNLPLSAVSLTTVSKWMGPVSKWPDFFAESRDRGYHMLHWTTLRERGESNSPYSIRDQLRYEPSMVDDPQSVEDGGIAKVEEVP
jgi:glycogen debranching enzyme